MSEKTKEAFVVTADSMTGVVTSATLYGVELLNQAVAAGPELLVNAVPLSTRLYPATGTQGSSDPQLTRFKGERFTEHLSGWGLVMARLMGRATTRRTRASASTISSAASLPT